MFRLLFGEDDGATMVEYSIMVVFIAAICVGIVATLGTSTNSLFQGLVDAPW